MHASLRHIFGPTILALVLGLAGCVTGTSAPTSFYVLTPVRTAPTAQAPALAQGVKRLVVLKSVNLAPYLDRPQIVSRGDGVRVFLAEFDRWAEPLDQNLSRVLAEDVARFTADSALVLSSEDSKEADARVSVDVERFDGSLNGQAVLTAGWVIRDQAGQTLRRGRAEYRQDAGGSYASLVEAQSALAGRLAQDIAMALSGLGPMARKGR
jgi:uncharacterized protein